MKSKITTMTIILALLVSTIYAQSIPQKISFQGRLIDANTQKPVTAEKNFTFKIGEWIEEHKNVQVSNGLYSVILGSANPIPLTLFNDWQANMKILVDGNEMAPDIEMVSVPYAFKAGQLDGIFVNEGNMGIGIVDSKYSLHVKGSSVFNGNVGFYGTDPNSTIVKDGFRLLYDTNFFGKNCDAMVFEKTDGNGGFPDGGIAFVNRGSYGDDGNPQTAMVIKGNGNVGIGTKNPLAKLHIRNIDDNADQYSGIRFYPATSEETGRWSYHTISGVRHSGLWLSGSGYANNFSKSNIIFNDDGIFIATSDGLINPENNKKLSILNNGNVVIANNLGIGTVSPQSKLEVVGDIVCNKLSETSDIRYKKNITPIQTPLQKVTQLKGINYEWKTEDYPEKNFSNGKQIGMIAQDVEKVIPEIVHTDNEGMKSISYDKITAVLVEAMKELNQKNEKAIQELKAENTQLKQIICEDRPNHEFCQN